jgi:acyl-CoA synthetase (AMP-forming)/AMP-acid ligase II
MAWVILRPSREKKWERKEKEFEKDVIQFAKQRLPGFACPEWVRIVKDFPTTS